MKYQDMSDKELNKLVSRFIGHSYAVLDDCVVHIVNNVWTEFDPCNSWTDAGPIIHENCISLYANKKCKESWLARCGKSTNFNENPLRAAMVAFLMMRGGE